MTTGGTIFAFAYLGGNTPRAWIWEMSRVLRLLTAERKFNTEHHNAWLELVLMRMTPV
jgi:hypothetical protein